MVLLVMMSLWSIFEDGLGRVDWEKPMFFEAINPELAVETFGINAYWSLWGGK